VENKQVSEHLTLYHKAGSLSVATSPEVKLSDYLIKDCGNNGLYKIIRFKHSDYDYISFEDKEEQTNENKLANNICRARSRVLELALCNEWEWFINLTLDSEKYDRYELEKFQRDLSQWFRDMRKKYKTKFQYLIIPETHKDGAWHMHGLLNGVPQYEITNFEAGKHPDKLIRKGYKNFQAYADKFGFISMGKIQDKAKCALYIVKYITKDLIKRLGDKNRHLFYSSQKLKEYENIALLFGSYPEIDVLLVNHGEFCSTGIVVDEKDFYSLPADAVILNKPKVIENKNIDEIDFLVIQNTYVNQSLYDN